MTDEDSNKGGIICCVLLLVIIGIFAFIGSQLSSVYFDNGYENSFDIFVDGKKEGSVAPNSIEKISIKKGEHTIKIQKKDGELFESNNVTLTEFKYIYNIGRKYLYYMEICEYKVGGGTKWGGWDTKNIGSETLIKYPEADYCFDEDCPGSIAVSAGNTYEERTNLKKKINPTAVELSRTSVTVEDVIEVDTYLCRVPYAEECSHKKDCCNLTISGVLDDHYTSTGNYHLSVYVGDIEIFYCDQSPFSHGKPHGRRFSNWKIIKVPVPNHVMDGEKISITLEHTDSPKSDWIGIDYLEFEFDGKIIRKELNEYKNYGVKDGAAGILYGDESQTWEIKLMAADEMEENKSHHETSVDKSLVGYWNFDEDSGGVASDVSGNGNDGTIHGAKLVDGKYGKALEFDGKDDYVGVSNSLPISGTNEVTIEYWLYLTSHTKYDICGYIADRHNALRLGLDPNKHIFINAGTHTDVTSSAVTFDLNKWYHYAMTVKGGEKAKVYVNGELVFETTTGVPTNLKDMRHFAIGASDETLIGAGIVHHVHGTIDEVAIHSRVLTSEEIKAHCLVKRDGGSVKESAQSEIDDAKYINPEVNEAENMSNEEKSSGMLIFIVMFAMVGLLVLAYFIIKKSDGRGKTEKSGVKPFTEKDNRGTRQDTWDFSVAYWTARNIGRKFEPFALYIFDRESDAREALLELDCIHVAEDTGKLICTETLTFGYYRRDDGVYEAIIGGEDLTHELWAAAKANFAKHDGKYRNDQEPEKHASDTPKVENVEPDKVTFVRDDHQQVMGKDAIYRIHKGPDAASAKAFLEQNPVTRKFYYIVVETPEGNYCRDIQGIYKE